MTKSKRIAPNRKLQLLLLLALLFILVLFVISLFKDIGQGRHTDNEVGRARVVGAGASFPAPLYLRWFRDIYQDDERFQVDYQSVGSGAGINDFLSGRTDFAGSDYPLSVEKAKKVDGGVLQLPLAAGAIVFVFNVEGVEKLNLSREALAQIFLGKIQRWNHPLIQQVNPGIDLPDQKITLVVRAEASGTTFHVSTHIASLNALFSDQVGAAKVPNWPEALKKRGALIMARGNFGVASMVESIPGAIGYVQFSYAKLPGFKMAALENRAGNMIYPETGAFRASIASVEDHLTLQNIADPEGEGAYPIISFSWLIMRRQYQNPDVFPILEKVVHYGLGPGQEVVESLGYIRFPETARKKLLQYFDSRGQSGPLLKE